MSIDSVVQINFRAEGVGGNGFLLICTSHRMTPTEIRQKITNQIVESLRKGGVPFWKRPWTNDPHCGSPMNLVSKQLYRGINPLVLTISSITQGFASRYWASYRQWQALGGQVRKGCPPGADPGGRCLPAVAVNLYISGDKENQMGWLFTDGQTLKQIIARRIEGWDHTNDDGVMIRSTCLRHCYRGGSFSGVLWTVWERTFTKDGVEARPSERWIGCDLLQYQGGRTHGFGYKDMEEAMGPYQTSCPLGYLALVPVACETWREGVRQYHARQKEKRDARRVAKRSA